MLSGFFFGFIGYFGMSLIHANLSVNMMLFWRFLVSSIVMGGMLLVQRPSFDWKTWGKSLCHGVVFYGPSSTLYFMAADYIGSGLAMVIFFTYPAMVMVLNRICYQQRVNPMYYVAVVVILIGMLFLMRGNPFEFNVVGIALSLLSAALFAGYIIVSQHSAVSAQVDTLMVCVGATLSALIAVGFEPHMVVPTEMGVWLNIFGLGLISTVIPILLLLKGLKQIGSLQASILSVLEPVFVLIFGIILLGEHINIQQFWGIVILLSGALLSLFA